MQIRQRHYSNSPTKLTDRPKLYIDSTEIEFKYLGISLDEQQLSFKYQIAHIRGKIAAGNYILAMNKKLVHQNTNL